ncbi:hypothetical protein [Polaribacter vadi]|uniref:hypothetical protein n=1 Tax=Polaribacter vadi TaxID=1774273 RepID=UPI0030ECDDE3|tara:strand:+ start:20861 stop:21037 length:177 start_codon:yes stop_codon:yes gene_type:complete
MLLNNIQLRSGVVGGTFLSTAINFSFNDVLFTAVMAIIGAVVSFIVSYILQKMFSDKE